MTKRKDGYYLDPFGCKIVGLKYIDHNGIKREKELNLVCHSTGISDYKRFKTPIKLFGSLSFIYTAEIMLNVTFNPYTGDFKVRFTTLNNNNISEVILGVKLVGRICSSRGESFPLDWTIQNTNCKGVYKAPKFWCDEDMYIIDKNKFLGGGNNRVEINGNLIDVCLNKMRNSKEESKYIKIINDYHNERVIRYVSKVDCCFDNKRTIIKSIELSDSFSDACKIPKSISRNIFEELILDKESTFGYCIDSED